MRVSVSVCVALVMCVDSSFFCVYVCVCVCVCVALVMCVDSSFSCVCVLTVALVMCVLCWFLYEIFDRELWL